MKLYSCWTPEEAREFAALWLPAWTGNDPEGLASFYSKDAIYLDPQVPEGLRGRSAITEYFGRLLDRNPNWIWTQRRAAPLEGGFLNYWHAHIPVGDAAIECDGVCTVLFDEWGLIRENEVFFDSTAVSAAVAALRGRK